MAAVLFSFVSFLSTLAGGLFALKYDDRLHYILSFTAGVLIGVVSFDIIPEIFGLAQEYSVDATGAMIALVGGFLFFHSLEKFFLLHHSHEKTYAPHSHTRMGILSAGALAGHSLIDGIGIGLAFQVSAHVGVVVAIAVIAHDFCDGLNTISLMRVHGNTKRRAQAMLAVDAIAPVVGVASTLVFRLPPSVLMLFLGFFSGFLLYIGASDILPEAHSRAPASIGMRLVGLTCLGAVFIFVVIKSANSAFIP